MAGASHYTYHLSGRRPATIFVLGVSLAMLAFGAYREAPWYFLVPVGLSTAMALWAMIANPQAGSKLTADTLYFYNGSRQATIPIKDIASMKISKWSDGPDTVALTLKSGDIVDVPSMCADSKLAGALRELGVVDVSGV
jgi:hypothetical protein